MSAQSRMRRSVWLASAALTVVAFACKDFLRTNPYDYDAPFTIVIQGPDTLFSLAQIGSYKAVTVPVVSDTAIKFESSDEGAFAPAGPGSFESMSPPLWPATNQVLVYGLMGATDTTLSLDGVTVQKKISRRKVSKAVILTQRITTISIRCPDTHACAQVSVVGTWQVWSDGFDAGGLRVNAFTSLTTNPLAGAPFATFVSRDTTIASVSPVGIRAANVTARKVGSTWIVAARGTLLDSLALVVH